MGIFCRNQLELQISISEMKSLRNEPEIKERYIAPQMNGRRSDLTAIMPITVAAMGTMHLKRLQHRLNELGY